MRQARSRQDRTRDSTDEYAESSSSRRIVRENFAWAIGYNLLALPLAAAGMVTPWIAAIGMALSSLLVTLNALRLTRLPASRAADTHAPRI